MKKVLYSIILSVSLALIFLLFYVTFLSHYSSADCYTSMTDLQQDTKEGQDWQIHTHDENNSTIIVAPHGGGIEPGTTEIARSIANKSSSGFYSFSGIRPSNNRQLHVTSTNYDEPKAQEMVQQSLRTVTIHKTKDSASDIYIGGRDDKLKHNIKETLQDKGFNVTIADKNISGNSVHNIANQNKNNAGVQIEISSSFVQRFFESGNINRTSRENTNNWTATMDSFTSAVSNGISK